MKISFEPSTVAVVTGASRGIGFACAQALSRAGATCVIVARKAATLASARSRLTAGGARVIALAADVSDGGEAADLVERIEREVGPIDILINSAGAAQRFAVNELGPSAFAQGMQAKYFPTMHMLEPVARRMAARQVGSIVNIIGQGGRQASAIHISGGAANAALMLATVGMARAYADRGVRINGINPGLTNTDRVTEGMQAAARASNESVDQVLATAQAAIPIGRMAEPEEIANVAVFLASDLASYVTGAIIPMDGGSASVI